MNLSSGYPFWLVKNGLPYDYPRLEKNVRIDVVILGGGISGALSAYYLSKAGLNCMVVDARTIGLGSTCASTSLLQYEIDIPLHQLVKKIGDNAAVKAYKLCEESIFDIKKLSNQIGYKEYESKKSLYYAAYSKHVNSLEKEFESRKKNGFAVSFLSSKDIKNEFGFIAPAAILSDVAAQINAYSFTHKLHQETQRMGTVVYDRTPIANIEHTKQHVKLLTENGHKIIAKKIVYATGYEVVNFINKRIVDLRSTYAIISEQTNEKTAFWKDDVLIWNTANPYLYMRTTPDKRILVGGGDEFFYDPAKRDSLINHKKIKLTKSFNKLFPNINFVPEFAWTGTFGSTADGLPFIGAYKKLPNSYFALGFGGNGITFSMVAAKILTSIITGHSNKDAALFSFDRV